MRRGRASWVSARQRSCSGRIAAAAALLWVAAPTQAGPAAPSAPPPERRLEVGFEERVRTENWDNLADFDAAHDDVRHQWRFRTRLWTQLHWGTRLQCALGLNSENRYVTTPQTDNTWDEILFESLWLDYRFTDRFAVRAGRQNLTRGDGFLVWDGGPLDGSRTGYFNALVATCTWGDSKLDLLAISDPSRDEYLPRIHDQDRLLIEWDEGAIGLAYSTKARGFAPLEAYWWSKRESDDVRGPDHPAFQPDRTVHTLGTRLGRAWEDGWSVRLEFAGQAGREDPNADLLAWAAHLRAEKSFGHSMQPVIAAAVVALSGDDPATSDIEGWDPLFARWPKWSELYLYTLASERGVAYWTNLALGQLECTLQPHACVDLRATYYRLAAFHPFPGNQSVYGGGTHRGDMLQFRAGFKTGVHWRGHLLGEWLAPGGFYAGGDDAWFLRAEVIGTIQHVFGL